MSDGPKPYMGQVMAECDCQHYGCVNRGYCMADRIEALVKERDEALEWLSASQGYIADAVFALDKQEKAEAKLAAMEVIATQWKARAERLEAALNDADQTIMENCLYSDWVAWGEKAVLDIRTALKGADHD